MHPPLVQRTADANCAVQGNFWLSASARGSPVAIARMYSGVCTRSRSSSVAGTTGSKVQGSPLAAMPSRTSANLWMGITWALPSAPARSAK